MLNSKQRAALRGIAGTMDTIFQVGKGGINEALISQVSDALRKRELIKLRVLDNSAYNVKGSGGGNRRKNRSDVVQVIGNRFVIFKRNPKEPVIDIKL